MRTENCKRAFKLRDLKKEKILSSKNAEFVPMVSWHCCFRFATLETKRELERKCIPQLFLIGSQGTCWSVNPSENSAKQPGKRPLIRIDILWGGVCTNGGSMLERNKKSPTESKRTLRQALSELHRHADRIDAWLKPNKNQKQKHEEALPILEKTRNEFLMTLLVP